MVAGIGAADTAARRATGLTDKRRVACETDARSSVATGAGMSMRAALVAGADRAALGSSRCDAYGWYGESE